jgi:TetR/AcrR family transcriptional repressor of bet genes
MTASSSSSPTTPAPAAAAAEGAATRRAQAKAGRRLALIEATITSVAAHGLSGTTLARVTDLAGTSIGLANFHFDSKERLFEAVLQHLADEQRALWQKAHADPSLTPAGRLLALLDARFHPRACDRKKLAVWFAFWGDAGARDIYRRIVGGMDDERLEATVAIIESLGPGSGAGSGSGAGAGSGPAARDAREIALGLEAFYDGLWLNHLLYPQDFRRPGCRARALDHLAALFPEHFARASALPGAGPDTAAHPDPAAGPGGPPTSRRT